MGDNITMPFNRLRQAWMDVRAGKNPVASQHGFRSYAEKYKNGFSKYDAEWYGATCEEVDKWVKDGYTPKPGEVPVTIETSDSESPVMEFDEENGNFIYDAYLDGSDMPYTQWGQNEAKRGLIIKACYDFNCGTPAKVIADYLAFILRIIDDCETRGISPGLELFQETRGSYAGRDKEIDVISTVMKREGEINDSYSWRSLLSPAGFRTLGFLALALHGQDKGYQITSSLGYAVGNKWSVEFDATTDTLIIDTPQSAHEFPEDEMAGMFAAAMNTDN